MARDRRGPADRRGVGLNRVGNDVVDLRDPRCAGKAEDERFLRRVFTDVEIREIRGARDPDRALWVRWAAKEAAFKVVSKLLGSPPPFEHRAFRVRIRPDDRKTTPRGSVRYGDGEVPFEVDPVAPDRIHVTAWEPGGPTLPARLHREVRRCDGLAGPSRRGWREELSDRFTAREWAAIHGPASALVRLRARASLAGTLGVPETSIEIVCENGPPGRSVPRVLREGEASGIDISLSHHHRLLAWAFALSSSASRRDHDSGSETAVP